MARTTTMYYHKHFMTAQLKTIYGHPATPIGDGWNKVEVPAKSVTANKKRKHRPMLTEAQYKALTEVEEES